MTRAQAAALVAQNRATYRQKKDGIDWWQLPNGSWIGVKDTTQVGVVKVRRFPAGACACG